MTKDEKRTATVYKENDFRRNLQKDIILSNLAHIFHGVVVRKDGANPTLLTKIYSI